MAYFLRQEKKKNRTYLQMYENFWDKQKKQPRTRHIETFGYVDELISDEMLLTFRLTSKKEMPNALLLRQKKPDHALFSRLTKSMPAISFWIHCSQN